MVKILYEGRLKNNNQNLVRRKVLQQKRYFEYSIKKTSAVHTHTRTYRVIQRPFSAGQKT